MKNIFMNKLNKFFILAILSIITLSCNMDDNDNLNKNGDKKGLTDLPYLKGVPGTFLDNITLDNNNVFYFVSSEIDHEAWEKLPIWSSYIPFKGYLSRKKELTGNCEILADFFGGKLCFDKNNNPWVMNSDAIYKLDEKTFNRTKVFETSGILQFIAVDNDNNIWSGGLQTGLYKVDSEMNVTHYDVDNSILPSTIIDAIHIDANNTVWVGFWGGVLKISDGQRVVYDNFTSQRIWSMVTDKNGYLWAGTGHFNEATQSLVRFDGSKWETINPRNDKNEYVRGTVRHLRSDGNKIYVVAEHVKALPNGGGAEFTSNELLTFNGTRWDKVYNIPEDNVIKDLVVDYYRQAVWVITANNGIFKIPM